MLTSSDVSFRWRVIMNVTRSRSLLIVCPLLFLTLMPPLMTEGTFCMPRGVFLTPHIVHSAEEWPSPVAGILDALSEVEARVNVSFRGA